LCEGGCSTCIEHSRTQTSTAEHSRAQSVGIYVPVIRKHTLFPTGRSRPKKSQRCSVQNLKCVSPAQRVSFAIVRSHAHKWSSLLTRNAIYAAAGCLRTHISSHSNTFGDKTSGCARGVAEPVPRRAEPSPTREHPRQQLRNASDTSRAPLLLTHARYQCVTAGWSQQQKLSERGRATTRAARTLPPHRCRKIA